MGCICWTQADLTAAEEVQAAADWSHLTTRFEISEYKLSRRMMLTNLAFSVSGIPFYFCKIQYQFVLSSASF
uniref:Uncharacterized protein n=1 Tax=Triticum urartu TaxID=4572 RepID=A0A8R7PA06_TRIUA